MKQSILLTSLLLVPLLSWSQNSPGEAATIKKVEINGSAKPGGGVTAEIHVKIEKGYHTHSNKPSEKHFIPTVLTIGPVPDVTVEKIDYPPGQSEAVAGLDKPLSVYEGEFAITARLKLGAGLKLPATVPAVLGYQACKGAACFRPQKLKFDISIPPSK
ncbi:MAG TPA: protein-disulfide reductase DsbD domain-containing protein [Methylomirabilota bacterium]|nr:protein-disulfide reductase DsbD domain-containing protein [Methylomirabilota bacterium]